MLYFTKNLTYKVHVWIYLANRWLLVTIYANRNNSKNLSLLLIMRCHAR